MDIQQVIQGLINVSRQAGQEILKIYEQDFDVISKDDNSPLTQADKNSNQVIVDYLKATYPMIPIISEENKQLDFDQRKDWSYCWVVDPLDGTKEFIKKNGEFTTNIALVKNNVPILGVVYIPVQDKVYYASQGLGAWMIEAGNQPVQLKANDHYSKLDKVTVVASRSHLSDEVLEFVEEIKKLGKEVEFLSAGSSLKFCLVAEGKADVYPRLAPTMEWDTAAADAVVREAGKQVLQFESREPLAYNKEDLLNPWFIVE